MKVIDFEAQRKENQGEEKDTNSRSIKEVLTDMTTDVDIDLDEVGHVTLIIDNPETGELGVLYSDQPLSTVGKLELAKQMIIGG